MPKPVTPVIMPVVTPPKADDYVIDVKYRPKSSRRLMFVLTAAVVAYLAINGRGPVDNWRYWYITEYRNTKIKTASATESQDNNFSINRIGLSSPMSELDAGQPITDQYRNSLVYYQSSPGQTVITAPARSNCFEIAPLSLLNQVVVGDNVNIKINSATSNYKVVKIIKSDVIPAGDLGDIVIITNDYTGLSHNVLLVVADKLL